MALPLSKKAFKSNQLSRVYQLFTKKSAKPRLSIG